METLLQCVPNSQLGDSVDDVGAVMTVRRWILYGHFKKSPWLEWFVIAVYLLLNVLCVQMDVWSFVVKINRGVRTRTSDAEDSIDMYDQLLVVLRCIVSMWSMFQLAMRSYMWSKRNEKLVKSVAPGRRLQHGIAAAVVCHGICYVLWDFGNGFPILSPLLNSTLVKAKGAVERILGEDPALISSRRSTVNDL